VITREAVEGALRALDTRGEALVLDVVSDTDVDDVQPAGVPRRLSFRRDGVSLDALVDERADGLQVVVRLTPPQKLTLRALTRGRGLTVPLASSGRGDARGVASLGGLPRGITSLLVESAAGAVLRSAWVRL